MSIGEDRVRVKFNPCDYTLVSKIKQKSAALIDLCSAQQNVTDEQARLWDLARTYYENAAMWAVKAATTDK